MGIRGTIGVTLLPATSGIIVLILIMVIDLGLVRDAVVSYGAESAHVLLDHFTEGPLLPVTNAAVQQHSVGDEQHLLDGGFTFGRALPAVEQLPAV